MAVGYTPNPFVSIDALHLGRSPKEALFEPKMLMKFLNKTGDKFILLKNRSVKREPVTRLAF